MSHIENIKGDLEVLKEIILENVPTDQIWLFGSYAYGTPRQDSDIDVYIVMKDDADMRNDGCKFGALHENFQARRRFSDEKEPFFVSSGRANAGEYRRKTRC